MVMDQTNSLSIMNLSSIMQQSNLLLKVLSEFQTTDLPISLLSTIQGYFANCSKSHLRGVGCPHQELPYPGTGWSTDPHSPEACPPAEPPGHLQHSLPSPQSEPARKTDIVYPVTLNSFNSLQSLHA